MGVLNSLLSFTCYSDYSCSSFDHLVKLVLVFQLVLSWHMNAATACEFSKEEFFGGLQALG